MGALVALGAAGATWALSLGLAVAKQGRLVFGSTRARRAAPAGPHGGHRIQEVQLDVGDGVRLEGWLARPAGRCSRVAVWFGGRNEDVAWTPAVASWLGDDWAVCAFNYRGCGGSTGYPGEVACVADGLAITDWAVERTGLTPADVVVLGRSLGSGVAVQVAAQRSVAGMVLLTPPASMDRILRRNPFILPGLPWLRHRFDSLAHAPRVGCPALVVLSERDARVPHADSRMLARALGGCSAGRVVTIPETNHCTIARNPGSLAAIARFTSTLQWEAAS